MRTVISFRRDFCNGAKLQSGELHIECVFIPDTFYIIFYKKIHYQVVLDSKRSPLGLR